VSHNQPEITNFQHT